MKIYRAALAVILLAMLIAAACTPSNPGPGDESLDWCTTFDFTDVSYGVSFVYGSWEAGTGLIPDAQGRLVFAYTYDQDVYPAVVTVTIDRILDDPPPDPKPTLNLQANAIAFGIAVTGQGSMPDADDSETIGANNTAPDDHGSAINANVQGSAPFALSALYVAGFGENPFLSNDCGSTPTPSSTSFIATDYVTSTAAPTGTPTWSPTPSPTPTATATLPYAWCQTYDFRPTKNGFDSWAHSVYGIEVYSAGTGFHEWNYYGWRRASASRVFYAPTTSEVTFVEVFYHAPQVEDSGGTSVEFSSDGDSDTLPNPSKSVTYNGIDIWSGGFRIDYTLPWGTWGGADYNVTVNGEARYWNAAQSMYVWQIVICGNGTPLDATPDATSTPTSTPTNTTAITPSWSPSPTHTNTGTATVTPFGTAAATATGTLTRTPVPIGIYTAPPLGTLPPPLTPGTSATPNLTLTAHFYETGTPFPGQGTEEMIVGDETGSGGDDGGVLGGIGQVGRAILGFGTNMLNIGSDFAAEFGTQAGTVFTAWNDAVPQPIPYLPNCIGSSRFTSELCAIYYILSFTVFTGLIGGLLIPLGSILLGFVVIIVVIQQVRATLVRLGEINRS